VLDVELEMLVRCALYLKGLLRMCLAGDVARLGGGGWRITRRIPWLAMPAATMATPVGTIFYAFILIFI
jgi:hypothetical protein